MMLKKTLVFALATAAMCSLASCGGKDPRADRPNRFTFSYNAKSGYGADWVKSVTDYYMDSVDTTVYIELKESLSGETSRTEIEVGESSKDIYALEVDMESDSKYLCDLTDSVYNYDLSAFGEEGKVIDRINKQCLPLYNQDGKYYRLPQTAMTGWNWMYNETTLNEKLGQNNWKLPKTTDEFFALGDRLNDAGAYLTAFAGGGTGYAGEYTRYGNEVWFAHMTGHQGFTDYFGGFTRDAEGNKKFEDVTPTQISNNDKAINSTYEIVRKLFGKNNGYVHKNSDYWEYTNIDQALYNGKVRGAKLDAPIAFAYVGSWLETEIQDSVTNKLIDPTNQHVKAMKTPINSDIISRTPTIKDDETLSKVIAYIDGDEGASLPEGVSQDDLAIVAEARTFIAELICREIVIPEKSTKKDLTTKFMAWLTTTTAQKIASKATKGVNVLPYGYTPTDEDMGFEISEFLKSVQAVTKDATILDLAGLGNPYKGWFSVAWCCNASTIASLAFSDKGLPTTNPCTDIYDKVLANYNNSSNGMKQFKEKYPDYGK